MTVQYCHDNGYNATAGIMQKCTIPAVIFCIKKGTRYYGDNE